MDRLGSPFRREIDVRREAKRSVGVRSPKNNHSELTREEPSGDETRLPRTGRRAETPDGGGKKVTGRKKSF